METSSVVRKPAVAGQFYPGDPSVLRREIESYLDAVNLDRSDKDIVALVAPHAGYMYSGPVAAYAYRQVQGKEYRAVVVISPSHRVAFGYSSVFCGKGYQTPLGLVPVDQDLALKLGSSYDAVRVGEEGHSTEHALEVQLPFLQVVLGSFSLVPVIMGSQRKSGCDALGLALGNLLKGVPALIVASSDLSHYRDQNSARGLDQHVVRKIDEFDPEGLLDEIDCGKTEACGAGPVAAAMIAARTLGAVKGENLHYATSGDTSGDYSHVVGYTAGIFYR